MARFWLLSRQQHYRATLTNSYIQSVTPMEVPSQEEDPGVRLCEWLSVKECQWCCSPRQQWRVIARVLHAQMIHCYHSSRCAT